MERLIFRYILWMVKGTWRNAFAFSKIAVTETFVGTPGPRLGRSITVRLRVRDCNNALVRHDFTRVRIEYFT